MYHLLPLKTLIVSSKVAKIGDYDGEQRGFKRNRLIAETAKMKIGQILGLK